MNKTRLIAVILSLISWFCFLTMNSTFNSMYFYYYLLIPTVLSFILGVVSFYKITGKSLFFLSLFSIILSLALGILLSVLLMVGEIIELN
ncbi:hypothetical protein PAECIP111894_05151 [Paenibacillus pseudetheri]|uniref:Uncharacterized protein n=1 Tax=Paenibacillus pseudetheri TaxID=2897682 RepID=A0ABM9BLH9_9BACL|nr:hypothetical protein PAECIP111894_05151 [Paenibacillus pseudetheri]